MNYNIRGIAQPGSASGLGPKGPAEKPNSIKQSKSITID